MTETETTIIHRHADIRLQTIKDAEAFIASKRVRRLVLLQSYKEKQTTAYGKLKDAELARFHSREIKVNTAMEGVKTAIEKLERAIANLSATHSTIVNIEHKEVEL